MALSFEKLSPSSNSPTSDVSDDPFYAVVDRLKAQKALPRETFPQEMPFFTFGSISKESQTKELFQDISDPNFYKSLLKNIINLPEERSPEMITQRLSAMQVMGFAQIVLYKILPCCDENCANRPREVATHNQYKDYEYECPFYHHDKDHRRVVITSSIDDEFTYKANYFEDGKHAPGDRKMHSQNYFESMFHPLYYKMFRCKREYCNLSQFCPFYHSEDEKKTWDKVFSNFIRKDRISYVKDKQKYYEKGSRNGQGKTQRLNNGDQMQNKFNSYPTTPKQNNFRRPYNKTSAKKGLNQGQDQNQNQNQNQNPNLPMNQRFNNWKPHSAQKYENGQKGSNGSTNVQSSPLNFGYFSDQREALFSRAC